MKICQSGGGTVANADRIISNHALLLYTGEIARHYQEYKRFPSILIADDVVLHGRSITSLLSELEEQIFSALSVPGQEMSPNERYRIRRDLALSIDIFAYAVNKQPLLIEDIYLQKLQWEQHLYIREVRSLSQQISSFLRKADVPNTSYVLSFRAGRPLEPSKMWAAQFWSYRGVKQDLYFYNDPSQASANFLPTIRRRKCRSTGGGPEQWVTSHTLFGDLAAADLSSLCRKMAEKLDRAQLPWVSFILEQESPLLQKLRGQFISFVLSLIYLCRFLKDCGYEPCAALFEQDSDLEKIALNFGKSGAVLPELTKLVERPGLLQELEVLLCDVLRGRAAPFLEQPAPLSTYDWDRQSCNHMNYCLEDTLYNIGMSSERSAYTVAFLKRYQTDRRAAGTLSLKSTLLWKEPPLRFPYDRLLGGTAQKLSCVLTLIDSDLMAISFQYQRQERGGSLCNFLKAGELSTFSIPRRLHLMIPALALVERDCWRVGLEPQNAVKEFIQTLPDRAAQGSGEKAKNEQAALSFLKTQGKDFVDLLYDCGHTLNGWDIDLITPGDWMEEGEDSSYLSFIHQMAETQNFYLERANQFLSRA